MTKADQDNTTTVRPFDLKLAQAYRDLESAIGDLHSMAKLMEMAVSQTIESTETEFTRMVRARFTEGLKGQRIYLMTEDEAEGLHYALMRLGDLSRALHKRYHDAYEKAA